MTESLKYDLIERDADIEIRRYPAYIKAEVTVDARNYRKAVEKGFGALADFIFGNNITRSKIEMTTPVQAIPAEKIAMTTPVTITRKGQFVVAFIMPAMYTMDSLPVPNNQRVRITQVAEHTAAAIRFNGYFNPAKIKQKREKLFRWLADHGLEADGDVIVAGYNPPWVPGFIARNEVMVVIKKV